MKEITHLRRKLLEIFEAKILVMQQHNYEYGVLLRDQEREINAQIERMESEYGDFDQQTPITIEMLVDKLNDLSVQLELASVRKNWVEIAKLRDCLRKYTEMLEDLS